ncbi:hypothetical protein [uncultured Desulfovibrio sp.]|uniref:hypothetical protein n=1 Tax=uncultured Desulfovibrio sp. TaxID=167968 RepID=UPI0026098FBC|nr:hypothetical protein [uncultured Desulfovibrio sp.]
MFSGPGQIKRTSATVLLIGGVFLARGLILLRQASSQNGRENALHLYDTVNQLRTLSQRQIALDFQTLRGVAISLGHAPGNEILPVLKEDHNAFLRMGLAGRDGRPGLVEIGGELRRVVDLSGEHFFQEAIAGRAALSEVRNSPFCPGAVVYCAAPVYDRGGGISAYWRVRGACVRAPHPTGPLPQAGKGMFSSRALGKRHAGTGAGKSAEEPARRVFLHLGRREALRRLRACGRQQLVSVPQPTTSGRAATSAPQAGRVANADR